jgi:hypothetical protein
MLAFLFVATVLWSGCFFGAFNNQGEFAASTLTQGQETDVGNPVLSRVGTAPDKIPPRSCQGPYRYTWIGADSQPEAKDFDWEVSLANLPDSLEAFSDSACTVALSPLRLSISSGQSSSIDFYLNSKYGENYSVVLATVNANGTTSSVNFEMEFRGPVESVSLGYGGGNCISRRSGRESNSL